MRIKLIVGLVLFLLGMILQEVSYVIDMWILRIVGGIMWPVGLVMFTKASLSLKEKKQNDDLSHPSTEEDKT